MVIAAYNLVKMYSNSCVVDNISFNIKKGAIFGFLGKNGAGKSTTIGMLTGITIPTSGEIFIFDVPYKKLDNVKHKIGILPDTVNYYSELTALEHLKYFSCLKGQKMNRSKLLTLLEKVNLGCYANKKVNKFSLGMKKKFGIAQAILGDPELIFLDEPTAGLDPESAIEMWQLINDLASKEYTIFLTSHNLNEVEKICSTISIMDKGKIVCFGTMKELRNQFQQNIVIKIDIENMGEEKTNTFAMSIDHLALNITREKDCILVILKDEMNVPEIIRKAENRGLKSYSIENKQIYLEQIYFQTAKK